MNGVGFVLYFILGFSVGAYSMFKFIHRRRGIFEIRSVNLALHFKKGGENSDKIE